MKKIITEIFERHDPVMERALTPASKREWVRPIVGDHSIYRPAENMDIMNDLPLKPSAVLIPIVERGEQFSILLTKRSSQLKSHSGQVSFPGGRCDDEDAHAMATALREAREEINLPQDNAQIVGAMEDYETVTGYSVTPVVGFINPDFEIVPEQSEVEDVFEVPLDYILDDKNHTVEGMMWKGEKRFYYVFPHDDHKIWGATAAMLVRFANLVNENAN
jgi:8-oxo-dGTP pyrophosphatase MutT (NUDIX family)